MAVLRFLGALAVVFVLHLLMMRLVPGAVRLFDFFLLLVVANALSGSTLGGLLGGLVAGLAEDTVVGSLYGLHGLAGTLVGYCIARLVQVIVAQNWLVVSGLFALGSLVHQSVVVGLLQLLRVDSLQPEIGWITLRAAVAGVAGLLVFRAQIAATDRYNHWRQSRPSRVRLE